jgi:hypothetical protein
MTRNKRVRLRISRLLLTLLFTAPLRRRLSLWRLRLLRRA